MGKLVQVDAPPPSRDGLDVVCGWTEQPISIEIFQHPRPHNATQTNRYILKNASHMISEGSELLLLVPSLAGVVGSVVLPVLGAVPDGAIVLFSGMGENAQEELTIGVGALAGSTIFLLTIPWALCILGGRVHIDPVSGLALYKCVRAYASGGGVGCLRSIC